MIITHGRARRRMVGYACEVAATTARTGVPALIAESLGAGGAPRRPPAPRRPSRTPTLAADGRCRRGGIVNGPELTVGRGVIAELVRLAALEVPGVVRVGRGGPAWRRLVGGPAGLGPPPRRAASLRPAVDRRPARPGARSARPRRSGRPSRATVERLLGLELGGVTVLVDGVGG